MMNHKKKNAIILVAVSIAFVAIVIWIAWGNSALMVNEIKITNDKIPQSFEGFRIAQVSDLHNAELGKDNNKLIEKLNECEPDIIVLTGDLIDSNHTNLEVALSFARQAVKIAPCYFVTGNHEAWVGSQYEELKTSLENAGVTVLQDEAIELNYGDECIQLIGLNDPDFSERDSFLSESILETKLSEINISNGFTILVADGLFCREIDGLFCRSSPDIIVRRRCVLSHKRRGWLQPSPSFRYSRNLALQDELYHPVINNGPAVLVCVDKRLGTGPVNQSRDAG